MDSGGIRAKLKKRLAAIADEVGKLAAELREIQQAEQEVFDNRSETWQEGEKGEKAQELLDTLETAADALENVSSEFAVFREAK